MRPSDIAELLEHWTWEQAVKLYGLHGDGILTPLTKRRSDYSERRLREYFEERLADTEIDLTKVKASGLTLERLPENAPESLKELEENVRRSYKIAVLKFHEMKNASTVDDRRELNLAILLLFRDVISPGFQRLDYWREHGELMPATMILSDSEKISELETYTTEQLMRRKHTLRANISRDRKAGKEEKVKQWEKELEHVTKLLYGTS